MYPQIFGFVGLGLIGGSIARALRKQYPDCQIVVYDIDSVSIQNALDEGICNDVCRDLSTDFSHCDYLFLCTPVECNSQLLPSILPYLKNDVIVTDVGSVKTPIHHQICSLNFASHFIGGHPMTGSEKSGFSASDAVLLENAYYVLSPEPQVSSDDISKFKNLVLSLGAIPIFLDHEKHDYITAAISHLPHMTAFCLVNLIAGKDQDGTMKLLAAGGFKDITRIASSSASMWEQICFENGSNIHLMIDNLIKQLLMLQTMIEEKKTSSLHQYFDQAKAYRDSFLDFPCGPIEKIYSFSVSVPDQTGIIAQIAVLLSKHDISIKNIGINHNRETIHGALSIDFYSSAGRDKAAALLKENHYQIFL